MTNDSPPPSSTESPSSDEPQSPESPLLEAPPPMFQFRVRTMLVVMALVCWLAFLVYQARETEKNKDQKLDELWKSVSGSAVGGASGS